MIPAKVKDFGQSAVVVWETLNDPAISNQGLTGIAPCNRFLLLVMRQFWSAAKFRPARALAAYCPARMLLGVGSILLPPVRKATAPAETCTKRQYTPSVQRV